MHSLVDLAAAPDLRTKPDHEPQCHRQRMISDHRDDVQDVNEKIAFGEWRHALINQAAAMLQLLAV